MNGLEAIAVAATHVCENPDIKPKDKMRVMAEMLEPMLEALFGSEYEPYEKNASVRRVELNKYALDLRLEGKTYREIGASLGVSAERARQRVCAAKREEGAVERHQRAEIIGDLLLSVRLKNGLKHYGAHSMTFDEFISTTTHRWYRDVENVDVVSAEELLAALRSKGVSDEKIDLWKKRKGRVLYTGQKGETK